MRIMKLMIAAAAMTCATAQAGTVVSGCVTVTGVVNAEFANAVIVALSPAISGCTPNATPGVEFAVSSSQLTSITVANLNSVLASGLAALATGRQVEVLYDDSTSNCIATQIAVGGFHGECP